MARSARRSSSSLHAASTSWSSEKRRAKEVCGTETSVVVRVVTDKMEDAEVNECMEENSMWIITDLEVEVRKTEERGLKMVAWHFREDPRGLEMSR